MSQWARMLLVSQVSIIVFALVLGVAPHLYLAAFIAYLFVIAATTVATQRRLGRGGRADEILAGRKLYEERNALDIAVRDEQLTTELSKQARQLLLSFASLGVAVAVFGAASMVKSDMIAFLRGATGSDVLANFLYWLIIFETIFAASRLTGLAFGVKPSQQPPFIPSRYVVTDRGIVVPSIISTAIRFPLPEDYEITVNERRGFVEIRDPRGRSIRLYARNPRRLYELITSLNKRAASGSMGRGG